MDNPDVAKTKDGDIFAKPGTLEAFDSIITKGSLEKEVKVADGLVILLKPLTTKEQLLSETTMLANNENVGIDTLNRFRGVNILSFAIKEINGDAVEDSGKLFEKLMELPSAVINVMIIEYTALIKEQAAALGKNFVDAIRLF